MQLKNLVISDLKIGTKKNILKFIAAIIFSLICCGFLYQRVQGKILSGEIKTLPGIYDFALYIFGGMRKYTESEHNVFNAPVIWMGVQLLVCSCIFSYPISNIYNKGNNILLQYRSRKLWWCAKNIWTVIQVIIIYVCLFAGIVVSVFLYGNKFNSFSLEITRVIHEVQFNTTVSVALWFIILPLLHSIMAALCQINLSIIIGPIYSLIVMVAYQVLSAYIQSVFLLGNCSMLLRQNLYVTDGINTYIGIGIELAVSCFAVAIGNSYIVKKDIL